MDLYYNKLGFKALDEKKYKKAFSYFNKSIELEPNNYNNYMVYVGRGQCYIEFEQYDKAFIDFAKAIEIDPNNYEAYVGRGQCYINFGQYDKAITDFTEAIKINPNDKDCQLYINKCNAKLAEKSGDYESVVFYEANGDFLNCVDLYEELKDYEKVIEKFTEITVNAKNIFNEGLRFFYLKEYEKAIEKFTEAIKINPNDKDYQSYINKCNAKLATSSAKLAEKDGDYDGVAEFYKKSNNYKKTAECYEKNGDWAKTIGDISMLGFQALKDYNLEEAISYFHKVIELKPDEPIIYATIGSCYRELEEYEKAIEYFKKAIELGFSDDEISIYEIYVTIGSCYIELEEYKQAIKYYEKAEDLAFNDSKKNQEIYKLIGACYKELEEYENAIEYLKKAIESGASDYRIQELIRDCYFNLGEDEQAIKYHDNWINDLLEKIISSFKEGKYEDLITEFTKIIEIIENLPKTETEAPAEVYFLRAGCFCKLAEYDKAIDDLSKAIELEQNYQYYAYRAMCYKEIGAMDLCSDDIKKAILIKGDTDILSDSLDITKVDFNPENILKGLDANTTKGRRLDIESETVKNNNQPKIRKLDL